MTEQLTMTARESLLDTIERERAHWHDLVAEVGERVEEPGPMGEWSFKDLAAHLLGWRERTIARLMAASAGTTPPPAPWPPELDDDDTINAWIHERHAHRAPAEVLADVDTSYQRLADAITRMPESMIADCRFPWLDSKTLLEVDLFGHLHDEHEPSIRAWLDRAG
jgi:hypothetical protein